MSGNSKRIIATLFFFHKNVVSGGPAFSSLEKNSPRPLLPHFPRLQTNKQTTSTAPLPSTAARRIPAWTTRKHPSSPLLIPTKGSEEALLSQLPLPTPPAADSGAEPLFPGSGRKRGPPTLLQRVSAALFYLVPYIDVVEMGNTVLKTFPQMQGIHNVPSEFPLSLSAFFLFFLPPSSSSSSSSSVFRGVRIIPKRDPPYLLKREKKKEMIKENLSHPRLTKKQKQKKLHLNNQRPSPRSTTPRSSPRSSSSSSSTSASFATRSCTTLCASTRCRRQCSTS